MPNLRTQGPDLIDAQTSQVRRLWGVSLQDPLWQRFAPGPRLLPHGREQLVEARAWGANCVRVPFHPVTIRAAGGLGEVEREILRLEGEARELDLYLIIDFHGIGFPATGEDFPFDEAPFERIYASSTDAIRDFWRLAAQLSSRSDSRIVALELYNEATGHQPTPNSPLASSENWVMHRDWADELLEAVVRPHTETLALLGGLNYGYDLEFALHEPIRDPLTAYTSHPYPHHSRDKSWDRAFGILAQSHPVLLTEVGFSDHGLFDARQFSGTQAYAQSLRDYADRKQMSFMAWNFSTAWQPVLLADAHYQASPSGKFFREWMQSLTKSTSAKGGSV